MSDLDDENESKSSSSTSELQLQQDDVFVKPRYFKQKIKNNPTTAIPNSRKLDKTLYALTQEQKMKIARDVLEEYNRKMGGNSLDALMGRPQQNPRAEQDEISRNPQQERSGPQHGAIPKRVQKEATNANRQHYLDTREHEVAQWKMRSERKAFKQETWKWQQESQQYKDQMHKDSQKHKNEVTQIQRQNFAEKLEEERKKREEARKREEESRKRDQEEKKREDRERQERDRARIRLEQQKEKEKQLVAQAERENRKYIYYYIILRINLTVNSNFYLFFS